MMTSRHGGYEGKVKDRNSIEMLKKVLTTYAYVVLCNYDERNSMSSKEGKRMTNWKTRMAAYEVHEVSKKNDEVYMMMATGNEISAWCKAKNENHGYVEGLGGDKNYSCWAVEILV